MINLNHAVEVNMVFDVRSLIRNKILIFPMKTHNFQKNDLPMKTFHFHRKIEIDNNQFSKRKT